MSDVQTQDTEVTTEENLGSTLTFGSLTDLFNDLFNERADRGWDDSENVTTAPKPIYDGTTPSFASVRQHRTALFVHVPFDATEEYLERTARFVEQPEGAIKRDVYTVDDYGNIYLGYTPEVVTDTVDFDLIRETAAASGYVQTAILAP